MVKTKDSQPRGRGFLALYIGSNLSQATCCGENKYNQIGIDTKKEKTYNIEIRDFLLNFLN